MEDFIACLLDILEPPMEFTMIINEGELINKATISWEEEEEKKEI